MAKDIAYCTIASANYLSRVEVLETSLYAQNPNSKLHVLLCEHPDLCRSISEETGYTFISPDQVCPHWLHMSFYYDISEFNTALKPFLIEFLFKEGYEAVIYFDPDIEIFGSLNNLEDLIEDKDLILTPHISHPIAMDGFTPGIDSLIRAGQFNLGFIALANSDESRPALKWWQDVCIEHCICHPNYVYFVDQFWADILPSFIQNFYCLRDPAYNMAYWNIFQRRLVLEDGKWITECGELKFFHFSGFLKNNLTKVSIHQNRVTATVGSNLHTMMSHYLERINSAKWSCYDSRPYSFGTYTNGEKILPAERKRFYFICGQEREEIGNPFEHCSTIRNIRHIDIERLDQYVNLFHYRIMTYYKYVIMVYQEYINSIRVKGFLPTQFFVLKCIYRKAMNIFIKKTVSQSDAFNG